MVDSTSIVVRQRYFILRAAVARLLSIALSFHACRSRAGRSRARRQIGVRRGHRGVRRGDLRAGRSPEAIWC